MPPPRRSPRRRPRRQPRRPGSAPRSAPASTPPPRPRSRVALPSAGTTEETPAVNAAAEAECPDGNDAEVGMATRRDSGTPAASASGRRRAPASFKRQVHHRRRGDDRRDPGERRPASLAPADDEQHRCRADPELRVIGGGREPAQRRVDGRRRRRRDRPIDGSVDIAELAQHPEHAGSRARSAGPRAGRRVDRRAGRQAGRQAGRARPGRRCRARPAPAIRS